MKKIGTRNDISEKMKDKNRKEGQKEESIEAADETKA